MQIQTIENANRLDSAMKYNKELYFDLARPEDEKRQRLLQLYLIAEEIEMAKEILSEREHEDQRLKRNKKDKEYIVFCEMTYNELYKAFKEIGGY
jgi:hypothetical protein